MLPWLQILLCYGRQLILVWHYKKHLLFMVSVFRIGIYNVLLRLSYSDSMFDTEIMFVGGKIYYSFNKPYKGGNTGPAEQQVQYAHSDLTHVKFVDANSPKKNSQKSGGYFTLDRPGGTDAFINHLLVVVRLLCLCRLVWMYRRMILLLRVGLLEIGLLIVRLLPARRRLDLWLCS